MSAVKVGMHVSDQNSYMGKIKFYTLNLNLLEFKQTGKELRDRLLSNSFYIYTACEADTRSIVRSSTKQLDGITFYSFFFYGTSVNVYVILV